MWHTKEAMREKKMALAGGGVYQERTKQGSKLSGAMAMFWGVLVTLEIMVAGAMIFNFDFRGADAIATVLVFVVLYFGVVAALTDR